MFVPLDNLDPVMWKVVWEERDDSHIFIVCTCPADFPGITAQLGPTLAAMDFERPADSNDGVPGHPSRIAVELVAERHTRRPIHAQ